MPEKHDDGIIYYRAKGDAIGSVVVGFLLLILAVLTLTQEGIGGIPFSRDLQTMGTFLALPLGLVLVLANALHAVAKGPTVVAGEEGIVVLYTPQPVGPIRWAEIRGFTRFRSNGNPCLGIVLEDPEYTIQLHREEFAPLIRLARGKKAHLGIRGKMLDAPLPAVLRDLDELRQVQTWHLR